MTPSLRRFLVLAAGLLLAGGCAGRRGDGGGRGTGSATMAFAGSPDEVYAAFLQNLVGDAPGYTVVRQESALLATNELTDMRFEFRFRPAPAKKETLVEARASSRSWTDKEAAEAAADAVHGLGLWLSPELRANLRASENAAAVGGGPAAGRREVLPKAVARNPDPAADRPRYRVPENEDYYAVVVGIERYSDLPEARFAEADAEAVEAHLLAMGFPRRNVILLTGEKAVRSALAKYVESWLPRNAGPASRVLFYFAGHGAAEAATSRAYLVPWDGDAEFLDKTGYSTARLFQSLRDLRARETLVLLDSCFSGAGGRSVIARGSRPLTMRVDTGVLSDDGLLLLAAAQGNQETNVSEESGHGLFTYYLLKGLNGEAEGPGGRVSAAGLYRYLRPKVQDEARRRSRSQDPAMVGSPLLGEMLLR